MSGDLYTTPTGRRLLRAVDDGDVYQADNGTCWIVYGDPVADRCTFTVGEMVKAGWVEPGTHVAKKWGRRFQLTDAGRAVLDGAR